MFQNKVSERPFNKNLKKLGNYVSKKVFYYSFYGELIPSSLLNQISPFPPPPSQIGPPYILFKKNSKFFEINKPPRCLIEDLR